MKVIGIIPARYASTRLPGKPLVDICGKTMIQRVVEQTRKSSLINDVIVATDDARIESAVKAFHGTVAMTSPALQSGSDRIAAVAKGLDADIIVNIQGDEPLIDPHLIDQTIRLLVDDPDAVAGTAVKKITDQNDISNPNVVKAVLDNRNCALYFSRAPIPFERDPDFGTLGHSFYKHFGLYVYRSDFLQTFTLLRPSRLEQIEKLEQLRILENGYRVKCAVTDYDSFPVDTPDDLAHVQKLVQSRE